MGTQRLAVGHHGGNHAVVVKLTRTLLIIPVTLALGALVARRTAPDAPSSLLRRARRLVPWFLVGFLLMAAANSLGLIPAADHGSLQQTSVFLITMALAAIGLRTDVDGLRRAGVRPLLLGAMLWVVVSATSLLLQWAAG